MIDSGVEAIVQVPTVEAEFVNSQTGAAVAQSLAQGTSQEVADSNALSEIAQGHLQGKVIYDSSGQNGPKSLSKRRRL